MCKPPDVSCCAGERPPGSPWLLGAHVVPAGEAFGAAVVGAEGARLTFLRQRTTLRGCAFVDEENDINAAKSPLARTNESRARKDRCLDVESDAALTGFGGGRADAAARLELNADLAVATLIAVGTFHRLTQTGGNVAHTVARFGTGAVFDDAAGRIVTRGILEAVDAARRDPTGQAVGAPVIACGPERPHEARRPELARHHALAPLTRDGALEP